MAAAGLDVAARASRIAGQVSRKPLLSAHALFRQLGAALFRKLERRSAPID